MKTFKGRRIKEKQPRVFISVKKHNDINPMLIILFSVTGHIHRIGKIDIEQ